jgi:hypothetical protein
MLARSPARCPAEAVRGAWVAQGEDHPSVTKEGMARLVAQVAGEMSLALLRPGSAGSDQVQRWIDTLRRVADALQARLGAAG